MAADILNKAFTDKDKWQHACELINHVDPRTFWSAASTDDGGNKTTIKLKGEPIKPLKESQKPNTVNADLYSDTEEENLTTCPSDADLSESDAESQVLCSSVSNSVSTWVRYDEANTGFKGSK